MNNKMTHTIDINGMLMDYAVYKGGEKALVIIPGLSIHSVMMSADMVKNRYRDCKKDFTLYIFDRRKNAPSEYSIEEMADDTAAAMKKAGIEKAYVFGASQGGIIAQYIAIKYPALVQKLVLCSTLAKANPTSEKAIMNWISLAEDKNTDELISDMFDKIYSKYTLEKYRNMLIKSVGNISDYELKQFIIMAKSANNFSTIDRLHEIKCPVLVTGSCKDEVTTKEGLEEIAKTLNCEIFLYDESYGHGVYDEAKDFPERVLNFFRK